MLKIAAALCLALPQTVFADSASPDLVRGLKKSVVSIAASSSQGLAGDDSGTWYGSGFIVDAARGLIVTNRHVSGSSPAQYKVTFHNGESTTRVRLKYYDAWHDFAFLEIDKDSVKLPLQAAALGESAGLKEQDKVFLIGNDDGQEYTVLYGELINTSVSPAMTVEGRDRHAGAVQVAYPSQGGSSGSPVFNLKGQVVGLHYKGTANTGFELRIEYVKDALQQLAAGQAPCRADIGCDLDLIKVSEAQKHFHLPDDAAARIQASGEGIKNALIVHGTVPLGSADGGVLQPGDVIVSVDGRTIGDNLYAFDKAVDGKRGQKVRIGLVRNGLPQEVLIQARDAESNKVKRFAQFGGGIIHDLTPELRRRYNISAAGVFLSQAEPGSSMSQVGNWNSKKPKNRLVVIEAVNGAATPDLDAFLRVASGLKDGEDINLVIRDSNAWSAAPTALPLTLSLKFHPLKEFRLQGSGEWAEASSPAGGAK